MKRRTECIALQKEAESSQKKDQEQLQRVRSCLEVLQSDRKRWNEKEEKLLETLEQQRKEIKSADQFENIAEISFTEKQFLEILTDTEKQLWVRSMQEQRYWKEKQETLEKQKRNLLAQKEELQRIQLEIQAETQKIEQREKTIREKELLEAKRKAEQKALQERIQEKEPNWREKRKRTAGAYQRMGDAERTAESGAENGKRRTGRCAEKADGSTGGSCGHQDAGSSG